jgi:integral membrane protein (TIGR01906 family)
MLKTGLVIGILLALVSPLCYASVGLSLLAFDAQFYQSSQIRLGWENTDQLAQWDRMLVAYFAGGSLDPTLQSLFSDRELVHLTDIRGLLGLLVRITEGLTAIYFLLVVLLFMLAGREALRLFTATVWVSAVLLLVAGGLIVLFFDQFFLQFHLLSFSNDFWQLGPQYLLYRLFPPGLFFQAALPYLALVFLLMLIAYLLVRTISPRRQAKSGGIGGLLHSSHIGSG